MRITITRTLENRPVLDPLVALIVDESKWLTASMAVALLAATALMIRQRRSALAVRRRVLAAMNLFFGVMIGVMAFGHLLAVTTKLARGTLDGPILVFYLIGLVLAAPSWWLIVHTRKLLAPNERPGPATLALNGAVAVTLLGLGVHNLPLAAPAFFNIGYQLHSRRVVGWAIVGLAIVANAVLFVGSLVFLMSGQSFEQFRGME